MVYNKLGAWLSFKIYKLHKRLNCEICSKRHFSPIIWFSAVKRIKKYTRSSQSEDRLSALAIRTIEKIIIMLLIWKIMTKFYDAVIDEFCKKERRIKLN